jgi:hypothetical protein
MNGHFGVFGPVDGVLLLDIFAVKGRLQSKHQDSMETLIPTNNGRGRSIRGG